MYHRNLSFTRNLRPTNAFLMWQEYTQTLYLSKLLNTIKLPVLKHRPWKDNTYAIGYLSVTNLYVLLRPETHFMAVAGVPSTMAAFWQTLSSSNEHVLLSLCELQCSSQLPLGTWDNVCSFIKQWSLSYLLTISTCYSDFGEDLP